MTWITNNSRYIKKQVTIHIENVLFPGNPDGAQESREGLRARSLLGNGQTSKLKITFSRTVYFTEIKRFQVVFFLIFIFMIQFFNWLFNIYINDRLKINVFLKRKSSLFFAQHKSFNLLYLPDLRKTMCELYIIQSIFSLYYMHGFWLSNL